MAFSLSLKSKVFNDMVECLGETEEEKARMRLEGLISDPINVFKALGLEQLDAYSLSHRQPSLSRAYLA